VVGILSAQQITEAFPWDEARFGARI
jgi:hypothetical protein